jgi:hypothetical protein
MGEYGELFPSSDLSPRNRSRRRARMCSIRFTAFSIRLFGTFFGAEPALGGEGGWRYLTHVMELGSWRFKDRLHLFRDDANGHLFVGT